MTDLHARESAAFANIHTIWHSRSLELTSTAHLSYTFHGANTHTPLEKNSTKYAQNHRYAVFFIASTSRSSEQLDVSAHADDATAGGYANSISCIRQRLMDAQMAYNRDAPAIFGRGKGWQPFCLRLCPSRWKQHNRAALL